MRISTFFCVLAIPLCSLTGYQEQPKQILLQPPGGHPTQTPDTYPAQTPGSYPAPSPGGYSAPDGSQQQPSQEDDDVAERSNRYEYNLYDRQQNDRDEARRDRKLQQQYYYQQSAGQDDTQYNRTKATRSQFFNPIGDD